MKLQKAGPEHCKHLRQIVVWAEITAAREWLIQFDTYRYGVEKVSESTMHTLMRRPLSPDDFEHDCMNYEFMKYVLEWNTDDNGLFSNMIDVEREMGVDCAYA